MKTLSRHKPVSYVPALQDDSLGIEAFAGDAGRVILAYSGKRAKPDFHIRYRSPEDAQNGLNKWVTGLKKTAELKSERKAARTNTPNALTVGDVLMAMWGYDQTNVDYYEVIEKVGKSTVVIRQIGALSESTGYMAGNSVPVPGQYRGEPLRRRVTNGTRVTIEHTTSASKLDYVEIEGKKMFRPTGWTNYS